MRFGAMQPTAAPCRRFGAHHSRRRTGGDDGATLIEFAIVAPLLFAILLGMFTGGLAFNQKLSVTNGAREGSRYGATLPVASSASCTGQIPGSMACWLTKVADITQQSSEGTLAASVSSSSICVAYVYPTGTATTDRSAKLVRTPSGDVITTGSSERCFLDNRVDTERRVQVTGSRQAEIEYVFGTSNPTMSSTSVTKFEAA